MSAGLLQGFGSAETGLLLGAPLLAPEVTECFGTGVGTLLLLVRETVSGYPAWSGQGVAPR